MEWWKGIGKRWWPLVLLSGMPALALPLGSLFPPRGGLLVDPHSEPADCLACHTEIPDPGDARVGDFHLKAATIDEACSLCHPDQCCATGENHQNHPSGIEHWDQKLFRKPKTLPLFNGTITCDTCHFYREAQGPGKPYLLRIVRIREDGKPDWDELCRDCHLDY